MTVQRLQQFQQAVDLADRARLTPAQFVAALLEDNWSQNEISLCIELCGRRNVPQEDPIEFYDWQQLPQEATGIALFGDPGSGKTCSAVQLLGLITQQLGPAKVMVMDLHNEPNKWPAGLLVLDTIEGIIAGCRWLLEVDLPQRRKGRRSGQTFPLTIWVLEELGGVIRAIARVANRTEDKAEKKILNNLIEDMVVELGGQGRKYNYLGFLVNQAGNAQSNGCAGLGDYLEAFHQVWLGRVAIKRAKQMGIAKRDRSWLSAQAYPCIVGDTVAAHPTHHRYRSRAKNQPPQDLITVRSLRWEFPKSTADVETVEIPAQPLKPSSPQGSMSQEPEISVSQWQEIAANAVRQLLETETKTKVITQVLGYQGRRYAEGAALLEQLLSS